MKRSFWKILLSALALLLLTACGAQKLPQESEVYIPEEQRASQSAGQVLAATYAADEVFSLNAMTDSSFHPYYVSSAWNQVVDMLVYEPMIAIDANFEAQPSLITAWTTEDGTNWVFSVDTSRRFHSGGRVTAYDLAYTIQLARDTDMYKARLSHVTGVSAQDDSTLLVSLDKPNRRFYALLDIPGLESDTFYSDRPGGTGPYKFSAAGDMLLLDENHPKADQMPLLRIYLTEYKTAADILQAFENSYIDIAVNDPTSLSNLGYSRVNIAKYISTTKMHYLGYNMSSVLMSQMPLRSAMTYAIDRSTIVSSCLSGAGVPAALPIHPQSSVYPADVARTMAYSPAKLAAGLEMAGLKDVDNDGLLEMFSGVTALKQQLRFIVCSDSSAKVSAARRIADELENAGLDVELSELSYADYWAALAAGEFDIYYAEVKILPDWDITALFKPYEPKNSASLNFGRIGDSMLNDQYAAFLSADAENQPQAAVSLGQYLAQSAPITVIAFEMSEVLYHRGVISGMDPTQDNIFNGMENWTVDLKANRS